MDFRELIKRNDLSKSCRACLGIDENMTLLVSTDEISIFDMFVTATDLQLDMSDSLPKYLCGDCGKALETSYKFRQVCHQTNSLLVSYLAEKCVEKDLVVSDPMVDTLPDHNSDEEQLSASAPNRGILGQFPYATVSEMLAQAHKTETSLECVYCEFSASCLRTLSIHMTHMHRELRCRWCPDCNATCDDLEGHKKTVHCEQLSCKLCNKSFKATGHLTEHLRRHGGIKPHACDVCNKSFAAARHLRVHYRTHTREKHYKCQMCDLGFIHYGSLLSHLKRCHNQPGDYGHKFDGSDFINKHNFCGTCNRRVRSLSDHFKKIHGEPCRPKDATVLCVVCGKQLGSDLKLKVHMRSHTGEAPYKCSYCELRTTTRSKMVVHERTHTGERPHVCRVCGKAFAQSSVLKTHSWLHLERPEACKICGQRFCRPTELKLHMRRHTGEKPFRCRACGRAFKQRSHLVGHEQTHSDIRPYRCHRCDKGFKQASTLKCHLRIHSGEKPHKCDRCDYACRQRFSLTQHVRRHHNDEPVAV